MATPMESRGALLKLAKDIVSRERDLDKMKLAAENAALVWLSEVIVQASALLTAKAELNRGQFSAWCESHIPTLSRQKIARYIRVADDLPSRKKGDEVKRAISLLRGREPKPKHAKTTWPAYLRGIEIASRLAATVRALPVDAWPTEGQDKLREKLGPAAAVLWPERFR